MLADNAADHRRANVFGLSHVGRQLLEGTFRQQIAARKRNAALLADQIAQILKRTGSIKAGLTVVGYVGAVLPAKKNSASENPPVRRRRRWPGRSSITSPALSNWIFPSDVVTTSMLLSKVA